MPDDAWAFPPDQRRALRLGTPRPRPGDYPVRHATARLAMDADRDAGWILTLDGVLTSYLDPTDPTHLEFEYVRWTADLLDVWAPTGAPLRVLHLGGGACTLPLYLARTRPGSRQTVLEYDDLLVALVAEQFGVRSSRALRIVAQDALAGLRTTPDASVDVVVRDAFVGAVTPGHLADEEYLAQVARVLRPGGVYVANVADRPPLPLTRAHLTAVRAALRPPRDGLAFVTDPSVLRGRRFGNVVVAASSAPLPAVAWGRAATRAALPARGVHGERAAQYG